MPSDPLSPPGAATPPREPRVHEQVLMHRAAPEPRRLVITFPISPVATAPPPAPPAGQPARTDEPAGAPEPPTQVDALVDLWRRMDGGSR